MNWPRLSVVVANYNHGKYLPTCLNALVTQSVQPMEIIVIDDASTDNSVEIIEGFARKYPVIRFFRNEKNQGALDAALRGMRLAEGDWVCFPAADDEVVPGFFEKSLRLLADHPEAGLSCTMSTWHEPESGLKWHMGLGIADKPTYLSPDDLIRVGRRGKLMICSSSAIMRKKALFEAGQFIPELRWHCDWFANYACAFRYGMCFVPEPLSDFYLHPTSYYHRGRKSAEHAQVLAKLLDKLNSPECADLAPRIRDSAVMAVFGWPMVRLMMSRPEYRKYLTSRMLLLASRRSVELIGKQFLPKSVQKLCLRLLYHHQPSTQRTAGTQVKHG